MLHSVAQFIGPYSLGWLNDNISQPLHLFDRQTRQEGILRVLLPNK
jgi:hypothetical protein